MFQSDKYIFISSSLVDISIEALGEVSLFPSLICMLGHSMAVYETQSSLSSIATSQKNTPDSGGTDSGPAAMEDNTNNSTNNVSFILISKSAKKKAQRNMRISQSEEIFQTVLDASMKV